MESHLGKEMNNKKDNEYEKESSSLTFIFTSNLLIYRKYSNTRPVLYFYLKVFPWSCNRGGLVLEVVLYFFMLFSNFWIWTLITFELRRDLCLLGLKSPGGRWCDILVLNYCSEWKVIMYTPKKRPNSVLDEGFLIEIYITFYHI